MPHQGRGSYDTFIGGPANPSSAGDFSASVTPGNACVSSVCLLTQDRGIRVWTLSDVPCSRKVVITPKGADDDKAGPSNGTGKGNPTVTPTYEIPTDPESGHKARLYPFRAGTADPVADHST